MSIADTQGDVLSMCGSALDHAGLQALAAQFATLLDRFRKQFCRPRTSYDVWLAHVFATLAGTEGHREMHPAKTLKLIGEALATQQPPLDVEHVESVTRCLLQYLVSPLRFQVQELLLAGAIQGVHMQCGSCASQIARPATQSANNITFCTVCSQILHTACVTNGPICSRCAQVPMAASSAPAAAAAAAAAVADGRPMAMELDGAINPPRLEQVSVAPAAAQSFSLTSDMYNQGPIPPPILPLMSAVQSHVSSGAPLLPELEFPQQHQRNTSGARGQKRSFVALSDDDDDDDTEERKQSDRRPNDELIPEAASGIIKFEGQAAANLQRFMRRLGIADDPGSLVTWCESASQHLEAALALNEQVLSEQVKERDELTRLREAIRGRAYVTPRVGVYQSGASIIDPPIKREPGAQQERAGSSAATISSSHGASATSASQPQQHQASHLKFSSLEIAFSI